MSTARNAEKLAALADLGVKTAVLDYTQPETAASVVRPGDVLVLVSGSELGQHRPHASGAGSLQGLRTTGGALVG